jgi:hypothetical protein
MGVQSATILVILLYVNYLPPLLGHGYEPPVRYFRDFCIWLTVLVTIWSALGYIRKAAAGYDG